MHEYDLARRTHAFFDSVLIVSARMEESPFYAVYRPRRHYDFLNKHESCPPAVSAADPAPGIDFAQTSLYS